MTSVAAILLCVVLAALAVFQVLLIAGVPIGRFAWGGKHDVLPRGLRVSSALSILIYALIAAVVLERAKFTNAIADSTLESVAMWVITGYFTIGIVMNAISRSKPERLVMTPTAAVLAVLSLIVALG